MINIALAKYQAIGNDYFVFDALDDRSDRQETIVRLCDRHYGVGSDGVLVFDRSRMVVRIFNPDGSEAETSGNGLRIAAAHAVLEHGLPQKFVLETTGRKHRVEILRAAGTTVESEVEMGHPSFTPADLPALASDGPRRTMITTPLGEIESILVSVGNPHCVVLGQPVTKRRCLELGEYIEGLPMFPRRTNVQLVEVLDRGHARVEIWERGAGYTLASGSSATAVAAALMRDGLVDDQVEILMPGGVLEIRRGGDGTLLQRGPASRVYRGTISLDT